MWIVITCFNMCGHELKYHLLTLVFTIDELIDTNLSMNYKNFQHGHIRYLQYFVLGRWQNFRL